MYCDLGRSLHIQKYIPKVVKQKMHGTAEIY